MEWPHGMGRVTLHSTWVRMHPRCFIACHNFTDSEPKTQRARYGNRPERCLYRPSGIYRPYRQGCRSLWVFLGPAHRLHCGSSRLKCPHSGVVPARLIYKAQNPGFVYRPERRGALQGPTLGRGSLLMISAKIMRKSVKNIDYLDQVPDQVRRALVASYVNGIDYSHGKPPHSYGFCRSTN